MPQLADNADTFFSMEVIDPLFFPVFFQSIIIIMSRLGAKRASLWSNQISLIHGLRVSCKSLSCLQFCPTVTKCAPCGRPCPSCTCIGKTGDVRVLPGWSLIQESTWSFKFDYRKICNIRRTKSPNLNVSRLVLQLSLPNPMKPGVKSRMKM